MCKVVSPGNVIITTKYILKITKLWNFDSVFYLSGWNTELNSTAIQNQYAGNETCFS